jgi:NAD(P)-dependent dehydrogenase (short-subunit alcohol dehydrogenase family)
MAAASKSIVLISGGNAGIGYEMVKKLATENPSTIHVLMGCRDTRKGETAVVGMGAPSNVNPIQLDITSDESIEHCFKTIEQYFGRLDILINNAGTAGRDLPNRDNRRHVFTHCYSVNVTSAACLTEAMIPLLDKSKLPKVIFISSGLGSISDMLSGASNLVDVPFYSATKAAMNYLAAYYSKKYKDKGWKVNAVDPGYNATGLNRAELTEETHPRNGAIRVAQLVAEGPDGVTGTFSSKERSLPW